MVTELNEKEKSALKKFRAAVEKAMAGNLVELKLFGSRARGDARQDSDIDVLVITATGDWHMSDVIYSIATDILLEDEVCISPKVINKRDYDHLCEMGTPFIKNVIREGITI
jgi:predicted nucleotidyltransferase